MIILPKVIKTKIVGVTRKNEDGTSRQELLEVLEVGDVLTLERDPYNEYDENAVEVHNDYGEQLGFLGRRLAADLAPQLDKGLQTTCIVSEVTNGSDGEFDDPIYGCNVEIALFSDEEWAALQPNLTRQESIVKLPKIEPTNQAVALKKEDENKRIFKAQPLPKPKAAGCLSQMILILAITALIFKIII